MNEFCRIIQLDEGQVLLVMTFNDEEDGGQYKVEQTTEINGARMTAVAGYYNEEKQRKHFETFQKEDAQTFFNTAKEMLS